MTKRILACFCTLAMLFSAFALCVSAEVITEEGISFSATQSYTMEEALSVAPLTFEAVVKLPKDYTSRGGVIVGNYKDSSTLCYSFEVNTNGTPRFFSLTGSGTKVENNINFSEVNIATGEYLHLAVVIDTASSEAHCYVDGDLKQTKALNNFTAEAPQNAFRVGSDIRANSTPYFKGNIKSVAIYSNTRSAAQIAGDTSAFDKNDAYLLAAYDLVGVETTHVPDLSASGIRLINSVAVLSDEIKEKGGMLFDENTMYFTEKAYKKLPATFEAWVYIPTAMSERGGIILGNYGGTTPCFSFELNNNGAPRIYYRDSDGTVHDYKLTDADVRTGDWAHLAITLDAESGELKCYVNGTLEATATGAPAIDAAALEKTVGLGCDLRSSNEQYFKGALKSATLYSDVRTAEEIAADMTAVATDDEALIAHYDLSSVEAGAEVKDSGAGAYHMPYGGVWASEKKAVTNYAYSFCVVGDTQKVTYYDSENLHCIYDWIVANKDEKKIEYVFGLGDITENDTNGEWELAKSQITKLSGVVPYSIVRGNHDSLSQINSYFSNNYPYMSQFMKNGGFYENMKLENSWRTIKIGEVDYLMMTLDYGASDSVLEWASGVIEEHPDHRVIITTHAYLYRDGTTLDEGDVVPPTSNASKTADPTNVNNGDDMWDEFISKHENIFLVMSGHDPSENVVCTQVEGENGNIVTQMLIDPQGVDDTLRNAGEDCTGMITMLYFSEDGKTVTVETYSTIRDEYFKASNQYVIEIPEYTNAGGSNGDGNNNGSDNDNSNNNSNNNNGGNSDNGNVDTGDDILVTDNVDTSVIGGDGEPDNKIIGWVIGISVGAVAVAAVVAVVIIRKKKK